MRTGKERRLDMGSHHDRMERDKQDDKTVARFKRRPYSIGGDTNGPKHKERK